MAINLAPTTVMSLTIEGRQNIGDLHQYINRFHFTNSDFSIPTLADLQALITHFSATVQDEYLAMYTNVYTLLRYVAETVVDPNRIKTITYIVENGTRALPVGGQYLPPYVSKLMTWHSGLVSRRFNGKTFLSGGLETDQNAGLWDTDTVGSFGALSILWGEAMLAAYGEDGSSDFRLAVLSDPDHVLPAQSAPLKRSPAAANVTTANLYWDITKTMKRRQIGRGA